MSKVYLRNLWWVASLLLLFGFVSGCCSKKNAVQPKQTVTPEMPKPGSENQQQADSLKKAIDLQRQKKLKGQ